MRLTTLLPLFAATVMGQTTTNSSDLLDSFSSSLSSAISSATNTISSLSSLSTFSDDDTTTSSTRSVTRLTATRSSTATSNSNEPTMTIYGLNNLVNTYAASVVSANQAATTYAVVCSSGAFLCPTGVTFQMTQAPSSLQLHNVVTTLGITVTESYSCAIGGTTSASCLYSVSGSGGGRSTKTTLATSYTGRLPYATIVITAGQEILAAASTVPAPTSASASQGAAGRISVLGQGAERGMWYGLLGAMGVVGVLAVAL
ncbi:hypothetical protein CAC42_2249 [Sphaceloma murrayae]|uniref:Uncharacterized protein n=1 Tax=Sphaceloma murrayae TaxID=2082308 RepID=A0A2K1QJE3_9PEZI|nr:hypothetical protein CAC42_2249 [Sphaceloma murrayae]